MNDWDNRHLDGAANQEDKKTEPEVPEEFLEYLDDLRDSGETNMFGAAPYVQEEFDISAREAKKVLVHWMKTFGDRHPGA